jgi:hypothetical protein
MARLEGTKSSFESARIRWCLPASRFSFSSVFGLLAMAAGALAGVLASFFLRLPIRGIWKDAVLGLLGFLVFFVTTALVPRLTSLLILNLIDPVNPGLVVAALFPIVRQVLRFGNVPSNRTTNSRV